MASSESHWALKNFEVELDAWIEREIQPADVAVLVLEWVLSRMEDPYSGASRAPGLDNWWFARIPATYNPLTEQVVTCTYQIFEETRSVRCSSYALLSAPF